MSSMIQEDPIRAAMNATARARYYARSCVNLAEDSNARGLLEAVAENLEAEVLIIEQSIAQLASRCVVA